MTIRNETQGSIHQTDPHSQLSGCPFSSILFVISSLFNARAIFRIFLSSFIAEIPSTRSAMMSCMKSSLWYSSFVPLAALGIQGLIILVFPLWFQRILYQWNSCVFQVFLHTLSVPYCVHYFKSGLINNEQYLLLSHLLVRIQIKTVLITASCRYIVLFFNKNISQRTIILRNQLIRIKIRLNIL